MTTVLMLAAALNAGGDVKWVKPTAETRPWGVCHLLGNAVEKAELAKEMRRWSEAGLGGVRFVPVYAAKGNGGRNIATMSPEFVSLLKDANAIAAANGMKVDLSFGAGWCFGGRTIPEKLGCQSLQTLKPGEPAPKGAKLLFEKDGTRLVSFFSGQRVKRAQTIDSGPMMNPFSPASMAAHLDLFRNLDGNPAAYPRAAFHDSFEYECNWSDELPALFLRHRGYRIEDHYAELAGIGDADSVARVKQDYRETLSDILSKDVFPMWTQWCRERVILDLGEVCSSARVTVNGSYIGTVFMHPYRLEIPAALLKDGENALEVEVTNLGANRIRAMDRKGVEWKNFEDINMVETDYKPLDASSWPVQPSGLIGPVKMELTAGERRVHRDRRDDGGDEYRRDRHSPAGDAKRKQDG